MKSQNARILHSGRGTFLFYLIVCYLFLSALTACSASSSSVGSRTSTSTPTCAVHAAVSSPLFNKEGLQKTLSLPGSPFASVATHNGSWMFVSLDNSNTGFNGIAVLRQDGSSIKIAHLIPLPGPPFGLALSSDEHFLIVADGNSVAVLDTTKAEVGASSAALLGTISDGNNPGTIEVAFSRDGRYVFATDENVAAMSVIDFQQVRTGNFSSHASVGQVPLDLYPVGMALSPDNRYLYVTSEISVQNASQPGSAPATQTGTLTIVDIARAEHDPAHAVAGRVFAGCTPVRVVLSTPGDLAWVTARGSNSLLAFKTALLLKDPAHALVASIPVGSAPVGVILIHRDTEIVVANSNRFAGGQSSQTLMLVNVKQALAGHPALVCSIAVGNFPREMAFDGQTLLLTNYNSGMLSLIDMSKLP